jgi:hypothetical protein
MNPKVKSKEVKVIGTANQLDQRKSPRLQNKTDKGKPILKKAQELVARRCGILEEDKEMDSMTL